MRVRVGDALVKPDLIRRATHHDGVEALVVGAEIEPPAKMARDHLRKLGEQVGHLGPSTGKKSVAPSAAAM